MAVEPLAEKTYLFFIASDSTCIYVKAGGENIGIGGGSSSEQRIKCIYIYIYIYVFICFCRGMAGLGARDFASVAVQHRQSLEGQLAVPHRSKYTRDGKERERGKQKERERGREPMTTSARAYPVGVCVCTFPENLVQLWDYLSALFALACGHSLPFFPNWFTCAVSTKRPCLLLFSLFFIFLIMHYR